jgi:hypothetical protein
MRELRLMLRVWAMWRRNSVERGVSAAMSTVMIEGAAEERMYSKRRAVVV